LLLKFPTYKILSFLHQTTQAQNVLFSVVYERKKDCEKKVYERNLPSENKTEIKEQQWLKLILQSLKVGLGMVAGWTNRWSFFSHYHISTFTTYPNLYPSSLEIRSAFH
jgi:hypothetical protein